MGGREKEDKEGAEEEEEEEGAEERAVKEASERPRWKECEHEGEEREQVVLSGLHNRQGRDRPEKGRPCVHPALSVHIIGRPSAHIDQMVRPARTEDHEYLDTVVQVQLNRLIYAHNRAQPSTANKL